VSLGSDFSDPVLVAGGGGGEGMQSLQVCFKEPSPAVGGNAEEAGLAATCFDAKETSGGGGASGTTQAGAGGSGAGPIESDGGTGVLFSAIGPGTGGAGGAGITEELGSLENGGGGGGGGGYYGGGGGGGAAVLGGGGGGGSDFCDAGVLTCGAVARAVGTGTGRVTLRYRTLPEVGRCVARARRTAVYQNAGCTTVSAGEDTGKYEWQPGIAAGRFAFTNGPATLETAGRLRIRCAKNIISGHYTTTQAAALTIAFDGCEMAGLVGGSCHSEAAEPGEIHTVELQAHLGFIQTEPKPRVGWAIKSADGSTMASFACGLNQLSLSGGFVAAAKTLERMTAAFPLRLKARHGRQAADALEGAAEQELRLSTEQGEEPVGLTTSAFLTNQEPLEIRATA
jgi:hypothetical protein